LGSFSPAPRSRRNRAFEMTSIGRVLPITLPLCNFGSSHPHHASCVSALVQLEHLMPVHIERWSANLPSPIDGPRQPPTSPDSHLLPRAQRFFLFLKLAAPSVSRNAAAPSSNLPWRLRSRPPSRGCPVSTLSPSSSRLAGGPSLDFDSASARGRPSVDQVDRLVRAGIGRRCLAAGEFRRRAGRAASSWICTCGAARSGSARP